MTEPDTVITDNRARADTECPSALRLPDALAPVGDALLARARAEATLLVDTATNDAAAMRTRADSEAKELLAEAERAGHERAQARWAASERRATRARRAEELAAQRVRYDRRRSLGVEAVLEMVNTPEYPELLDALRDVARHVLGAGAQITDDSSGGLIARTAGRVLDLRLRTLAARAVDRLESGTGGSPR